MKLVVDASVALKWFLLFNPTEPNITEAVAVGDVIQKRSAELFAPPHWTLEVISVLAREQPQLIDTAIVTLTDLAPVVIASPLVLKRAAELSVSLNHHLFDTLYHAVARETGATLVTADKSYYDKARDRGSIMLLGDFRA